MLAHRLLVARVEVRVAILDDLAQAKLGQFLGHQFLVEQAPFQAGLVLDEGGDDLVEVLLADALPLRGLGLGQTLDLDLELARGLIDADVFLVGDVARLAIAEALLGTAVRGLGDEAKAWGEDLLHQQAGGDGLEGVVDRLGHRLLAGVGLGDQIGEAGAGLARGVAGGAADDLHHLGEAGTVADGEGVLAPHPVEALLGHAQGDDEVHMVAVELVGRVLQGRHHPVALGGVVVHQVGDAQPAALGGPNQLEAGHRVGALPFAQCLDEVLHLADLVLGALAGVDVGDVDDGLLRRVEDLEDVRGIGAGVEVVADVELLEVLVAVELFVVGVGDGVEAGLVLGGEHGLGVAAKIGAGHGHQVHPVAGDELAEMGAELVVRVGGDVVELVHRDQALVEGVNPVLVDGEAEGGVGADQHPVLAVQKGAHRPDLAALFPRGVAQVPLGRHPPVGKEAELGQGLVVKTGADGLLRHHDDGLAQALMVELVEGDEHQCPALARGRGRLDQQVLLAAFLVGALLHGAHAQFVGPRRPAVGGVGDGDRGDDGRWGHGRTVRGLSGHGLRHSDRRGWR